MLSYTFKGHIDPTSVHSHLIIHNATIDMHGKYRCSIKTDLGTHESEHDLVVISHGQCRFKDWRVASERLECREVFRLDCRQMFPRPVPSCGLWNDKLDKFIRSVTVDISEEMPPPVATGGQMGPQVVPPLVAQTYRVKYSDKFELTLPNGSVNPVHADLLQYAGHLIFKCDIVVPDTSWKLSMSHKMFDFADGCNSDPLETIERMRVNFSQLTRMRLHKHYHERPLDDIEMLTSNLKYEILPPPPTAAVRFTNKNANNSDTRAAAAAAEASYKLVQPANSSGTSTSSKQLFGNKNANKSEQPMSLVTTGANLNCWQRPRVGSIAKLSCVPPASTNNQRNQVKLSGTNLLQCRPTGHWVPINPRSMSSSSSSTIVLSNELLDPGRRAKGVAPKKAAAASSGPRRSTRRLQDSVSMAPMSRVASGAQVVTNSLVDNSDDQDGSDDSSLLPTPSSGNHSGSSPLIDLEVGPSLPSSRPPGEDGNGGDAAVARDDANNPDERQNFIDNNEALDDLTPAELASLLPSCVMVNANHQAGRRSGNQRHHLASSAPTNDRLPLLDDKGALLSLMWKALRNSKPISSSNAFMVAAYASGVRRS